MQMDLPFRSISTCVIDLGHNLINRKTYYAIYFMVTLKGHIKKKDNTICTLIDFIMN